MNHGAPAATTARSGCSGSNMRSAPRSSAPRAITDASAGWSDSTSGTAARQLLSRSSGAALATGTPGRKRASIVWSSMETDAADRRRPDSVGGHDHFPRRDSLGEPCAVGEREVQATGRLAALVAHDHRGVVDGDVGELAGDDALFLHLEQVGEVGFERDLDAGSTRAH